jgi:hypothetical protein
VIVGGTFGLTHAGFETRVIAILGLIYVAIRTMAFWQFLATREMLFHIDSGLGRIRWLLRDDEVEGHIAAMDEMKKIGDRRINRAYVDMFFVGFLSLICLYNLLS